MKRLFVICGPTASGKTSLAIDLAKQFNTDIISADSKQFFREMSIGTAKPTAEELAKVPHHFVNSLSVSDEYSAGDFEQDVMTKLGQLFTTKDNVVLVGGSGLYIKAVTEGLDNLPKTSEATRNQLNKRLETEGLEALSTELQRIDPERAEQISLSNPQRVIRSLEVYYETGQTYSSFTTSTKKERDFAIEQYAIDWERKVLYDRINERVEQMFYEGLIDEVKSLIPYKNTNALNTIGYNELFKYFDGEIDLEEAKRLIKRNTRRFAKRQITWLQKHDVQWLQPNEIQDFVTSVSK